MKEEQVQEPVIDSANATRDLQQMQLTISSYFGKLLRDTFGKGPEAVNVSIGHAFITIFLRNFLTPSERVLMEQDQEMIVMQMRDKLMETMMPELQGYIEAVTGCKPVEIYYDWGLHNRSGMIMGVFSEPVEVSDATVSYQGKAELEDEVVRISQNAQKAPEEIYSYELNPRTIVVVRNGILVRIEKELIRHGAADLLRRIKRNLEKSYLHNNTHLEAILNKRIVDSFVDWDFTQDKSLIVFVLNPKRTVVEMS